MAKINFLGRQFSLPRSRILRILLGVAFIFAGLLGFLPILGFWMIPVGLVILSIDFAPIRRWRRRTTVRMGAWLHKRWPGLARRGGFGQPRHGKRQ